MIEFFVSAALFFLAGRIAIVIHNRIHRDDWMKGVK